MSGLCISEGLQRRLGRRRCIRPLWLVRKMRDSVPDRGKQKNVAILGLMSMLLPWIWSTWMRKRCLNLILHQCTEHTTFTHASVLGKSFENITTTIGSCNLIWTCKFLHHNPLLSLIILSLLRWLAFLLLRTVSFELQMGFYLRVRLRQCGRQLFLRSRRS
uniref:Uncharacterized protein n=1 Tax=Arundo donax TaxID=35708 RepID=A0A0A9E495_ARUDO